jgi:flagellar basal-body rod protein FlgB
MKIFELPNIQLLKKSLDVYSRQHEAIAQNIAHANDDSYKRVKTDFGSVLKNDLSRRLKTTDPRHIAEPVMPEPHGVPNHTAKVDMSQEMGELAVNQIKYDFAARNLTRAYQMLNTGITGRNR